LRIGQSSAGVASYNGLTHFDTVINMSNEPDFDTLRHLSETDPQGYFAERARLIEAFLESVPPARREELRRFQADIDAVRASAGTPAKAVENLMGMLADRLEALLGHTVQLAREATNMGPARNAQV